jgi:hypothetical protein
MDYVIEDADYCEKHQINFMGTECHQCEQDAVKAQSTDEWLDDYNNHQPFSNKKNKD